MTANSAILLRMLESDLELASRFARIGHLPAVRNHVQSALTKLDQIDALGTPDQLPESQPISTNTQLTIDV